MSATNKRSVRDLSDDGENHDEDEELEEPTIDWANSSAKQILIDDLESGILPLDAKELSAKEAWDIVYQHMVEFHGVPYTQFRDRLNDLRKAYKKKKTNVMWDAEAIQHDRLLHPRKACNHRGEPVFSISVALELLAKDVKEKKHKRMKPKVLRQTRPEYQIFTLKVFRQRIYQQQRREKFDFYLEEKRVKKQKERQQLLKSRNPKKLPGKRKKKDNE
jgi:hypothetical protein